MLRLPTKPIQPLKIISTTSCRDDRRILHPIFHTLYSDFQKYNKIPNKENYKFAQGDYPVWFYEYKNYVIWGITARILENFLDFIKS